ncbi:zinc finger protein 677 isoform X2 [Ailuropoda melanoleuca]|uniref:zinc finger protein 677 isoform X2 n=1 Tax=Ailuropoda melanoleuca TaxID=9646 RepID=UPI0009479BB3|nr:zinc finger protein 677 isoform X2 [Ailuropoda melanoleuca]
MAGKRQESAELGGHQKVWGERTAGIETGCSRVGSKCWRRNSEGGKQKDAETEGNTDGQKERRETRTRRDIYREHVVVSEKAQDPNPDVGRMGWIDVELYSNRAHLFMMQRLLRAHLHRITLSEKETQKKRGKKEEWLFPRDG